MSGDLEETGPWSPPAATDSAPSGPDSEATRSYERPAGTAGWADETTVVVPSVPQPVARPETPQRQPLPLPPVVAASAPPHLAPPAPPVLQHPPAGWPPAAPIGYGPVPPYAAQHPVPARASSGPRSRGVVIAAVIIGAASLVAVLGFATPGFFVSKRLNISKAQDAITALLTDPTNTFGDSISDVRCNDGRDPKVKRGDTFTCTLTIDGQRKQVTATFTDNSGKYEVGVPK